MIRRVIFENKLAEYIEKLNSGYYPKSCDLVEKFSDGSVVNQFFRNHEEKIKAELYHNPKYKEGYDVARRVFEVKEIDRVSEFIEKLNQGYRPKCKDFVETFSDGSVVAQFWGYMQNKIKRELENNPKYEQGYEMARRMIHDKEIDKVAEYIEKLNRGYQPKSKEVVECFSDGNLVNQFWDYNKEKIKKELDSNPKYRVGYEVARKVIQNKEIDKVSEYIEKLNQGYHPKANDQSEKFSDGSYVNTFWYINKEKIKKELENNPKYSSGYEVARKIIQDKEINKMVEYIEKLNHGYCPRAVDSNEMFSDGSLVNQFWNNYKRKVKNELDSNPRYREGYEIAQEMVQLSFLKMEKRENKKLVKDLCLEYGIDVVKYKSILNKSYDEVYVKLCYLSDYGIPVMEDGILNPIFFMSDVNMQVEYQVSLEDLTKQYIKKNGKKEM